MTQAATDAIIVRTMNPNDITMEEAEQIAQAIRDLNPNSPVQVKAHLTESKGVTWFEIVSITLSAGAWATKVVAEDAAKEIAKRAVEWARQRFRDRRKDSKRPVYVPIYGPDGEVLKSVVINSATAEPEDRTDEIANPGSGISPGELTRFLSLTP
jgi:hypothetical protein